MFLLFAQICPALFPHLRQWLCRSVRSECRHHRAAPGLV